MELLDARSIEFGVACLLLLAVLTIGYRVVRHLRSEMVEGENVSKAELLDGFREAYEAGEMDSAEYRNVRGVLESGTLADATAAFRARKTAKPGTGLAPAEAAQKPAAPEATPTEPPGLADRDQ